VEKLPKIGIVMPPEYDIAVSGSITTWNREVYSDASLVKLGSAVVFGKARSNKRRYRAWKRASYAFAWINDKLNKIAPQKFLDMLWCGKAYLHFRKFDLIHVHNRPHYCLTLRKLGFKGKLILHLHNDNFGNAEFARNFIKASSLVVCCSNYLLARLQALCGMDMRGVAAVLHNGVDTATFRPGPKLQRQILFVGRFTRTKGIANLLDALQLTAAHDSELSVVLVGPSAPDYDWEGHARQVAKLEALGVVVSLHGHLEAGQLAQLYSSSTTFVMPSLLEEAFGMVAVEAMASGTAVVASNCGGIPEATGGYAILVNRTPEALSQGILELLNDEQRRKQLEEDGRRFVCENYAWSNIASQFAGMVAEQLSTE